MQFARCSWLLLCEAVPVSPREMCRGEKVQVFGSISVGGILAAGSPGGVRSSEAELCESAHKEPGGSASLPQTPDEHPPSSADQATELHRTTCFWGFYRSSHKKRRPDKSLRNNCITLLLLDFRRWHCLSDAGVCFCCV